MSCPKCGERATVEVGSYAGDQSYTDLNEDFAYFKVFTCPAHRGWVYRNVSDRSFDGSCSIDGAQLKTFDIATGNCPRCGAAILKARLEDQMVE